MTLKMFIGKLLVDTWIIDFAGLETVKEKESHLSKEANKMYWHNWHCFKNIQQKPTFYFYVGSKMNEVSIEEEADEYCSPDPEPFGITEMKAVWQMYRAGRRRHHIAQEMQLPSEHIDTILDAAQKLWGKKPRPVRKKLSEPLDETIGEWTRAKAAYSNTDYSTLYLDESD